MKNLALITLLLSFSFCALAQSRQQVDLGLKKSDIISKKFVGKSLSLVVAKKSIVITGISKKPNSGLILVKGGKEIMLKDNGGIVGTFKCGCDEKGSCDLGLNGNILTCTGSCDCTIGIVIKNPAATMVKAFWK